MNEKIINGLKFVDGEEIEYTKKSNEILKENPTYISFCTVLLIGLLNAWEQYEKSNKQKVLDLIRDNIFYILKNAYPLVYGFKKFLPGDTFIIHIQTKNDNYYGRMTNNPFFSVIPQHFIVKNSNQKQY